MLYKERRKGKEWRKGDIKQCGEKVTGSVKRREMRKKKVGVKEVGNDAYKRKRWRLSSSDVCGNTKMTMVMTEKNED